MVTVVTATSEIGRVTSQEITGRSLSRWIWMDLDGSYPLKIADGIELTSSSDTYFIVTRVMLKQFCAKINALQYHLLPTWLEANPSASYCQRWEPGLVSSNTSIG